MPLQWGPKSKVSMAIRLIMEHSMKWKDAGSAHAQLLIFMHILPVNMSYGKHINDFSCHAVDAVFVA